MIDHETETRDGTAPGIASGVSLIPGVPLVPGLVTPVPGPGEAGQRADHQEIAVRGEPELEPAAGAVTAPPARQSPDAVLLLREVLDEMGLLLIGHVEFPSRAAVVAVTLWIAQAAARDAEGLPVWYAYPRLLLTSRQNGSGKSSVGDLARALLGCRAGRMSKVTPYGLTKVFGTYKETAVLDDAQNVFKSDKAGLDLLSIMVNGYTDGATWVTGKNDGKIEGASGPMLIVGKDDLITKRAEVLADLLVRSVIVRLERPARYMPELDRRVIGRAARIGAALGPVMGAVTPQLEDAAEALAGELVGTVVTDPNGPRTAQIWRPLLAVARVAGGPWPEAAEQARAELSAASGDLFAAAGILEDIGGDDGGAGAAGGRRSFWDNDLAGRQDAPAA